MINLMRTFFLFAVTVVVISKTIISCQTNQNKATQKNKSGDLTQSAIDTSKTSDTFKIFDILNIDDSNIINTSDRQIDIILNGTNNYLGGKNQGPLFSTECMVCLPFQSYNKGILFGKKLFIKGDTTKLFSGELVITDTENIIPSHTYYGDRKPKTLTFSEGKVQMTYQGMSCIDADKVNVVLTFPEGNIKIKNLLNASFFEFDSDNDGIKEQFLAGIRNCSQEITVLRIKVAHNTRLCRNTADE